jgi:hypothetical protein
MAAARKHNITVAIDRDLLKRARGLAAKRGCSVSALLAAQLRDLVSSDQHYEAASRRANGLLVTGMALGGARMVDRQALHERHRVR